MFRFVRAAVCGLLIAAPGIVSAATLTATFNTNVDFFGFEGGQAGETAFVIDFDDSLGSSAGLLEVSEFVSFAWVNNPFTFLGQEFRTLLGVAPSISGFVVGFAFHPFSLQNQNWVFQEDIGFPTGSGIAASSFSYSFTAAPPPPPPPPPVPLPAGAFLLVGALAALAALRRRTV